MKAKIIEILGVCIEPELAELKAKEIMNLCNDSCSELLEACQAAIRIKDLWLYNEKDTLPEYKDEAQAVSKLESILNEAIKKAKI